MAHRGVLSMDVGSPHGAARLSHHVAEQLKHEAQVAFAGLKTCEEDAEQLKKNGFWFTSVNALQHEKAHDWETWSRYRRMVDRLISTHAFEAFIGLFILFQLLLAILETDLHIQNALVPAWIRMSNITLLCIYSIEIILRAFAIRVKFFYKAWNVLDLSVVTMDIFFRILEAYVSEMPSLATLRVLRLVRLARTFRAVAAFNELQMLIHLVNGAMRALFSAFILLLMACTMCSIVAVEMLQPIVNELAKQGAFGLCSRCPRAFESVMQGNLTWFQTIVMGDAWGDHFAPIMEHSPVTAVFIVSVTVSIAFGLMNILMSVIVSKAEDARRINEQLHLQSKLQEYQAYMHAC